MIVEVLAQVIAPPLANGKGGFCAAVVLWDDVVVEAAPCIGYMKKQKWSRDRVRAYCSQRGWSIDVVWRMYRAAG